VMGETPLEIAIRKFGRNSATEGLLNKLRRQPAQ
jgi:ribosomal protein S21